MKINLLNFEFSGIKNIQDKISLSFYKKEVKEDFSMQDYNVKSIYGPNGVGKTAIIESIDLTQSIGLFTTHLTENENVISELINQNSDSASFKSLFCVTDISNPDGPLLIEYSLTIKKFANRKIFIEEESLKQGFLRPTELVYKVKKGKIIKTALPNDIEKEFAENLNNRLLTSSFLSLVFSNNLYSQKHPDVFNDGIYYLAQSLLSLNIEMDDKDDHTFYKSSFNSKSNTVSRKNIDIIAETMASPTTKTANIISIKTKQNYEEKNKKLEELLKIIKPEIKGINLEYTKRDSDTLIVHKFIQYDNYEVNAEFESAGIKKLMSLFNCFINMQEGEIAIIDELDAHFQDVFLSSLLEYFANETKGQLIFTTHSLTPMDVLKDQKKSIDFLTPRHGIVPWKKVGNKSPSAAYRNGMIKGIPFNYDFFDFITVFE